MDLSIEIILKRSSIEQVRNERRDAWDVDGAILDTPFGELDWRFEGLFALHMKTDDQSPLPAINETLAANLRGSTDSG